LFSEVLCTKWIDLNKLVQSSPENDSRRNVANLTLCATKAWPDKVNNQQPFNYFRGREKLNNEDDLHTIKTFSGAIRKPPRFLMCINLDVLILDTLK